MQKRNTPSIEEIKKAKSGGIDEACMRYGLGKPSMRRVAEDAGAVIRIGRRYLINFTLVDKYIDSMSM